MGTEFQNSRSLAFPADAAVLCVFQNYTTICEFFADAVGGWEVAFLLGGNAFGDEFFDFRVTRARVGAAITKRSELLRIIVLDNGANFFKCDQKLLCRVHVALPEFAFVHGGIGIARERSEERRVGKECRSRWYPDV